MVFTNVMKNLIKRVPESVILEVVSLFSMANTDIAYLVVFGLAWINSLPYFIKPLL